jgi:hypothetical protein
VLSELDLSKYEGHTPGPWEVNKLPHQTLYACDTFIDPAVAGVWQCLPDAYLIADAPLLLAEVKQLRAARQAWAIRAAEESARADALLEAADALVRYSSEGADADWPDWEAKFDALRAAVGAAKVKHGE